MDSITVDRKEYGLHTNPEEIKKCPVRNSGAGHLSEAKKVFTVDYNSRHTAGLMGLGPVRLPGVFLF